MSHTEKGAGEQDSRQASGKRHVSNGIDRIVREVQSPAIPIPQPFCQPWSRKGKHGVKEAREENTECADFGGRGGGRARQSSQRGKNFYVAICRVFTKVIARQVQSPAISSPQPAIQQSLSHHMSHTMTGQVAVFHTICLTQSQESMASKKPERRTQECADVGGGGGGRARQSSQ
jgi:hypothetical protein